MSLKLICDICGGDIGNETYGSLRVDHYSDGYNTDPYSCNLHICSDCLFERIDEKIIANGRMEF